MTFELVERTLSSTYPAVTTLSFEDYLSYDDGSGRRYELLDTGELSEVAYENEINILLAMALAAYLEQFISRRLMRLNTSSIQVTPMVVTLPNGRTRRVRQQSRIPDLMVLTTEGAAQIFGKASGLALYHDNPMLIVEMVSQSNSDEDYTDKRAQYEARGVPEYWIVDRHQRQVTVLILEAGAYVETLYREGDLLHSVTFPKVALTANMMLSEASLWQAAEKS